VQRPGERDGRRDVACRVSRVLTGGIAGAGVVLLLLGPGEADAARHAAHRHPHYAAVGFGPGVVGESIVVDADTGRVLSEANADTVTYPASLTKMMTLYLTFEALNAGRLRLDQPLGVSSEAASQPPTKLGLVPGEAVTVRDLILGLVTKSANDAALVLAEGLAGSEAAFADRMNQKARQLGMTRTAFRNPNGLPDPDQRTTARDIAQLAVALYHDFPREYRYFATREFDFRGRTIRSHNHLLDWYDGADGIKTGYIRASGFNLAASAVRDGHRLIGVVMGGPSARTRDQQMADLLDQGFAQIGVDSIAVARHQPPPSADEEADAAVAPPAPAPHETAPGMLRSAANRLAAHLTPVAKAEAAPFRHDAHEPPPGERWCIQLGAFRAEAAAEKAARIAAALPLARGKPLQLLQPDKGSADQLYRARLLNFSQREAESACAALHKKKIECSVVPATPVKVAGR